MSRAHALDLQQQIAELDAAISRERGSTTPTARAWVAYALVGKGIRLVKLGRVDEGLEHFDDVVATFGKDADDAARVQVPVALAHRGRREPAASRSGCWRLEIHATLRRLSCPVHRVRARASRARAASPASARPVGTFFARLWPPSCALA